MKNSPMSEEGTKWNYNRRPVVALNTKGEVAGYFQSLKKAAECAGCTYHTLWDAIRNERICRKFRWMYESDYRKVWMEGNTDQLQFNAAERRGIAVKAGIHAMDAQKKERWKKAIADYQRSTYASGGNEHLRQMQMNCRKSVTVIETGDVFPSITEFCKVYNVSPANAVSVLKGRRASVAGVHLKYK